VGKNLPPLKLCKERRWYETCAGGSYHLWYKRESTIRKK